MIDEAEAAAKAWEDQGVHVKTIAQSANVDVPGQIAHVRNFVNQGVDAVINNPNSPTAFDPIIARCCSDCPAPCSSWPRWAWR